MALLLGLLLAAGAWFFRPGDARMSIAPPPTLSPDDRAGDARMLTLNGQSWYTLQLGVFDTRASALGLAESFQARGAGGYVTEEAPYRVLAAAYETRAQAQTVLTQLRTRHGVEACVHMIASDEVVLRVTGQAAQLTALADSLTALNQAAAHLSALSEGLDQHTEEAEHVRAALCSHRDTFSALAAKLRLLFGENAHSAVAEMQLILERLTACTDQAARAGSEVLLGARVKYCQLLCIDAVAGYACMLAP